MSCGTCRLPTCTRPAIRKTALSIYAAVAKSHLLPFLPGVFFAEPGGFLVCGAPMSFTIWTETVLTGGLVDAIGLASSVVAASARL